MASSQQPEGHEAAGELRRLRPRGAWRVLVANEISRLADQLALVAAPPELETIVPDSAERGRYVERQAAIVREHLERATEGIAPARLRQRVRDWYSGAAIEQAWFSLHRAGEALLMIQSPASLPTEFAEIDAAFESNVPRDDPRRADLKDPLAEARKLLADCKEPVNLTAALRSKLVAARHAANVTSDTAHSTVRSWRNALLLTGGALTILAIAAAAVHVAAPGFLSLVPAGQSHSGGVVEPWSVELIGTLGGTLAAVLALSRFRGFTDPYGLPTAQALLRLPTSAVTSLFGVLLMQTSALNLFKPQTDVTAILAFAFLFGYAQEPLLRMIDQRAGEVLNPARGKDEPSK